MDAYLDSVEHKERRCSSDCRDLLVEIHGLLEAYAPSWYTEKIHERTERVLKTLQRS